MQRADTAVIVLNWNNAADTVDCLESLASSSVPIDVFVVDNASSDDSVAVIESTGLATQVIRNQRNDGYAGGNNVGLTAALDAGYAYVAVLNNDTVMYPNTLERLVETCRGGTLCAVSPRIVYADRPQDDWFAGGVVDRGLPRHLQAHEAPARIGVTVSETLTGCCIVASRDVWTEVGIFDENYFLIFEDSDWSARAAKKGVSLLVHQEAVVEHKVSRSFVGGQMQLLTTYFFVRNGLRYHARHQRAYLHRFAFRSLVRPLLSGRGHTPREQSFAVLAARDAVLGRGGNASPRIWQRALRVADLRSADVRR